MSKVPVLSVMALSMVLSGFAWADGTITDGDATVEFSVLPSSSLDYPAIVTFRPTGAEPFTNRLWFAYRIEGDTREYPLVPDSESYNGASATFEVQAPLFDATVFFTVVDGLLSGEAELQFGAAITNPAGAASNLVVHLYSYVDIDVPFDSSDDQAALGHLPWGMLVSVFDGTNDRHATCSLELNPYQGGAWDTLLNLLIDSQVFIPDSSGFPFGPGDFALVEMKSISIPPGGTGALTEVLSVRRALFADGFESGDTSAWSDSSP